MRAVLARHWALTGNGSELEHAFPTSKLIGYDSATNQFYRTDTVQRFANRGQLADVVGQSIRSRSEKVGGMGGQGYAGWRTVARAAVLNDLKAAARLAPGEQNRGAILDRLREVGPRLERIGAAGQSYPVEERIFYSRASVEEPAAFSRSADDLASKAKQGVNPLSTFGNPPSHRPPTSRPGGTSAQECEPKAISRPASCLASAKASRGVRSAIRSSPTSIFSRPSGRLVVDTGRSGVMSMGS